LCGHGEGRIFISERTTICDVLLSTDSDHQIVMISEGMEKEIQKAWRGNDCILPRETEEFDDDDRNG